MASSPKQQRDDAAFYRPPGATEENWENLIQAIHALHRGNTTPERKVNSKQNSVAHGRPGTNPRAPSRHRVESGVQEPNSLPDNQSSPLATFRRIGVLYQFALVEVVKILSVDQVLALFASRVVINISRAPSLIRCPPFLKECSWLEMHCAEISAQQRYFPSGFPLPFHVNLGRDRTSREFFYDLPAES